MLIPIDFRLPSHIPNIYTTNTYSIIPD